MKKSGIKTLLVSAVVLLIIIGVGAVAGAAPGVIAADQVKIVIDGTTGVYTDMPIEMNDRILLPFREILTKLGVPNDDDHIIWNDDEESVTVKDGDNVIRLVIGSPVMTLNGVEKTFDVTPYFYEKNNRTYVPVRAVSELLDKYVMWDDASSTVYVRDKANYAETLELLQKMQDAGEQNKIYANSTSKVQMTMSSDDVALDGADENGVIGINIDMTQMIIAEVDENVYHIKQVMNMGGLKIGSEMVMFDNHMFMKIEGPGFDWTDVTEESNIDFEGLKNQAMLLEGQLESADLSDTAMTLSLSKHGTNYKLIGSPVSVGSMNSMLDSLTAVASAGMENVTIDVKINNMQIEETMDADFYPVSAASDLDITMFITETAANGVKATVRADLIMSIEVTYEKVGADFAVEIPAEVLAML